MDIIDTMHCYMESLCKHDPGWIDPEQHADFDIADWRNNKEIMNYNWESEQWTIPINLTVGKSVSIGGKPWKFSLEANYYFERADAFGAEWMVGLNVTPVIQNPLAKLFGR